MNGVKHGYGISRWADGEVYYGEYKQHNQEGQGHYKWANGNEYCGECKNGMQWGEGVIKENGQLYRDKFEEGKLINRSELPKVVKQK